VSRDPVPDAGDDAVAVTIGADRGPHAIPGLGRPASTDAFAIARALGVDPDPVVALAGVVAAGSVPGTDGSGDALEAAEHTDRVRRRPGVALPTVDLADGLAASMLVRTSYSGDSERARAARSRISDFRPTSTTTHTGDSRRWSPSTLRTPRGASTRAASAERALRPYATVGDAAPFETVGGYADVLARRARPRGSRYGSRAGARQRSGRRASGPPRSTRGGRTDSPRAHRALDDATIGRYDGCLVARARVPAGGDRSEGGRRRRA